MGIPGFIWRCDANPIFWVPNEIWPNLAMLMKTNGMIMAIFHPMDPAVPS
jgi:Gpi18-like mannosyltransferase